MSGANDARLLVNVAGLLTEASGSSRTEQLDGVTLELGPDLTLAGPIAGSVRIARSNRGVLVRGEVHAVLVEACSRCLRPMEAAVAASIDEEVLPSIDLPSGRPVDTSDEPEAARLTDHHEVDLEPLVREAILLAEPIASLCRPDCPGLCPVCGGELASGAHDHGDEPIDPRLEALRAFRVDGEAESE